MSDTAKKTASGRSAIDHDAIRELAKLLHETGLTEIEVEQAGARVRVARQQAAPTYAQAPIVPPPMSAPAPLVAPEGGAISAGHPGLVTSPMVGTAYRAPEPGARPFVDIGSRVKQGDPIMIIEAMKTLNQIPAPRGGTVTQILFEDGQPVEFGEALAVIE